MVGMASTIASERLSRMTDTECRNFILGGCCICGCVASDEMQLDANDPMNVGYSRVALYHGWA